ncbi:MAG TPA: SDR family NAD(P)-dependent oxidoreductase [Mycobacteriales bacterium]|nr:SDR family NAD(P)-dependent oxidoreductase [Mycobacteriales bacterium]
MRFDGRVAVVTGAGRGIGRAYALLLAARGAHVVVNDLGSSAGGDGSDAGPAAAVVEEITAAGGSAIPDVHDVSCPAAADALIGAALERWGRIDALVNNAGIIRFAGLPDADADNLEAHLAVHVNGTFNTVRAAWPHFTAAGYGRIVNTTSSGVFGLPVNLAYATAKGGIIGMTRSLAVAGEAAGIRVNAIAPAASTRMGARKKGDDPEMDPALVAPMAAYLAHESCPVTGEVYTAGAGRFARLFLATTPGYVQTAPTVEDVAAHWAQINGETGYTVPASLIDWSAQHLAHLDER